MTATAEQLDVLKQSLSNFKNIKKQQDDEEYIEEIFEDNDPNENRLASIQAEDDESNTSIIELTEQERIRIQEEEEQK